MQAACICPAKNILRTSIILGVYRHAATEPELVILPFFMRLGRREGSAYSVVSDPKVSVTTDGGQSMCGIALHCMPVEVVGRFGPCRQPAGMACPSFHSCFVLLEAVVC